MIEFPTDAKFSNMQITPTGTQAMYLSSLQDAFMKKNGTEWEIPLSFMPKDYARITTNDASFIPTGVSNNVGGTFDSGAITNGKYTVYTGTTYYLNAGGVYRFTGGTNKIADVDAASFLQDPDGHEIVESINDAGNYVYTIKPRNQGHRSIIVGNVTFKICTSFIKNTNGVLKVTGETSNIQIKRLSGTGTYSINPATNEIDGSIAGDVIVVVSAEYDSVELSQPYTVP